jgi:tetratricopeptide (TPR) repeat protein
MNKMTENKNNLITVKLLSLFLLLSLPLLLYSQGDKKYLRQGNREYEKAKFQESELSYRRAIDKNSQSADAVFNTGDALYRQNKFEDAGKKFLENHNLNDDRLRRSASLYNLGNSMLMADKVQESVEAYKGSLKLDPGNMEAKYNLAYAQDLLKQQQQQQQQEQNKDKQDEDKDKDKDQDKQDKGKKDDDQNQQQNKEQQKDQKQDQSQDKQTISKEDAERVLNALANDEKNVQEKVKLAKAKNAKVRSVKNW